MTDMPLSVSRILSKAGWFEGRNVLAHIPLPAGIPVFTEAERILASFGGLRFGNQTEYVLLDPKAAIEEDDTLLARCQSITGQQLYPIGYQEHQDRETVFVAQDGSVYMNFGDDLYLIAASFELALKYLAHAGSDRPPDSTLYSRDLKMWSIEKSRSQ